MAEWGPKKVLYPFPFVWGVFGEGKFSGWLVKSEKEKACELYDTKAKASFCFSFLQVIAIDPLGQLGESFGSLYSETVKYAF